MSRTHPIRQMFNKLMVTTVLGTTAIAANAAITLTPSAHDFGTIEVGQRVGPIRVTLYNEPSTGSDPILRSMDQTQGTPNSSLSTVAVESCTIGTNLMRGDSCVFDVYLTATEPGSVSRELTFGIMFWTQDSLTTTFTANAVPAGTPDPEPAEQLTAVPTLGAFSLGALSLTVGLVGWWRRRRSS